MIKKIIILLILVILLIIILAVSKKPIEDVILMPTVNSNNDVVVMPILGSNDNEVIMNGGSLDINNSNTVTVNDLAGGLNSGASTTPTNHVRGYYSTYDKVPYPILYEPDRDPRPATTTCTAFTVIDGDKEFIAKYRALIDGRNTVNRYDSNGNLMLNINLKELSSDEKKILLESTVNSQVSLYTKNKELPGKDGYHCGSFIELVSVRK